MRMRSSGMAVDMGLRALSRVGRLHPRARPEAHGIEVIRDQRYRTGGDSAHLVDIYRPLAPAPPRPVLLYLHGGGFRILSKDTHWVMGLAFAREGYLVFNANYRLAPRNPFPAALEDAAAAYRWALSEAPRWGGDPSRIVLAGESAGANLVTVLTIASCYRRPERWAGSVFDAGVVPSATIANCGLLQVSDVERFRRRRRDLPGWMYERMYDISNAYLGRANPGPGGTDLADPLSFLERGEAPQRSLPPFFASVGTRDPILDDTRRLAVALDSLGVECEARYYPGEAHAFQAMVWRPKSRQCWGHTYSFLRRTVGPVM
jgi:acetyl esterase